MADLVDAAASVEARLMHSERTLSDVRVSVARVETKLLSHEQTMLEFRQENAMQYQDLKVQLSAVGKQLEPLKEARWKASGAYSVMAAVVSAAVSLAIKLWK